MAKRRSPSGSTKKPIPQRGLAKVSSGGKYQYAIEFVLLVVDHANRHTIEEAADYYGVSGSTIGKWQKRYNELDHAVDEGRTGVLNPYRDSQYGVTQRIGLSDKLFAELEFTLEITKMKHGYVPADILGRLITGYGMLVERRRLEEGAYTALVQSVRDPEEIYQEGEAQVVQFRRRASLPAGD